MADFLGRLFPPTFDKFDVIVKLLVETLQMAVVGHPARCHGLDTILRLPRGSGVRNAVGLVFEGAARRD